MITIFQHFPYMFFHDAVCVLLGRQLEQKTRRRKSTTELTESKRRSASSLNSVCAWNSSRLLVNEPFKSPKKAKWETRNWILSEAIKG